MVTKSPYNKVVVLYRVLSLKHFLFKLNIFCKIIENQCLSINGEQIECQFLNVYLIIH